MLLEKSFKILSNIDILVALDKYNDFLTVTFVKCKITRVLSERDKKFGSAEIRSRDSWVKNILNFLKADLPGPEPQT